MPLPERKFRHGNGVTAITEDWFAGGYTAVEDLLSALPSCCVQGFPMLFKTLSAAVYGGNASVIEVEVDVSGIKQNEDHFRTVGLPDAARS